MLCQQLRDWNRSKREVEDFCEPLHEKSVQIRGEMALFGIKEVRTIDIICDDLEWQDDALLGRGAFAAVYRGKLKIRGKDKPVDVAVKVERGARRSYCQWLPFRSRDTQVGFVIL